MLAAGDGRGVDTEQLREEGDLEGGRVERPPGLGALRRPRQRGRSLQQRHQRRRRRRREEDEGRQEARVALEGLEGLAGGRHLAKIEVAAGGFEHAFRVPVRDRGKQAVRRADDQALRGHVDDGAKLEAGSRELRGHRVRRERQRGLPAMVAVGDDRLGVFHEALELDVRAVVADAEPVVPDAVGVDGGELGGAPGRERGRQRGARQQEDQLEVRLRRREQRQSGPPWAWTASARAAEPRRLRTRRAGPARPGRCGRRSARNR